MHRLSADTGTATFTHAMLPPHRLSLCHQIQLSPGQRWGQVKVWPGQQNAHFGGTLYELYEFVLNLHIRRYILDVNLKWIVLQNAPFLTEIVWKEIFRNNVIFYIFLNWFKVIYLCPWSSDVKKNLKIILFMQMWQHILKQWVWNCTIVQPCILLYFGLQC